MNVKFISGRNSSPIVAYYLRGTETGYLVATDVLTKIESTAEILALAEAQKTSFLEKVKARTMKPKIIEERKAIFADHHRKVRCGTDDANEIVRRVHTACQTMLYAQPTARTGNMFNISLPNDTSKSQVKEIVSELTALFPTNVPAVFTIHHGKRVDVDGRQIQNLHIQGWFSEKPWEGGKWGSPLKEFKTIEGMRTFRSKVDQIIEDAGAAWKKDELAPKVTNFHPAKSKFMKSMTHTEILKGDFIKTVYNPALRECLRQEVNRARYFESKRLGEECATAERAYRRNVKIEMANIEFSQQHQGDDHATARISQFGVQSPNHNRISANRSDGACSVRRDFGDIGGDTKPGLGSVFKSRKI